MKPSTITQPISAVQWVPPATLHANGYNPNRVFAPEFALLKVSILESGWTQPIVARTDGEIVDGFHRWTLGSTDAEIQALTGGLVPVVFLSAGTTLADQMMATVRHNRARGQHGILKTAEIVKTLRTEGVSETEIERRLGMEDEEVSRLLETKSSAELVGKDSFGRGWVPDPATASPKGQIKKRQAAAREAELAARDVSE